MHSLNYNMCEYLVYVVIIMKIVKTIQYPPANIKIGTRIRIIIIINTSLSTEHSRGPRGNSEIISNDLLFIICVRILCVYATATAPVLFTYISRNKRVRGGYLLSKSFFIRILCPLSTNTIILL